MYSVVVALLISMFSCSAWRIWFARSLVAMSAWYWVKRIFVPVVFGASISAVIGWMPRLFMPPSLCRIVVAGFVCDAILLALAWLVLLDGDEREFLRGRLSLLYRNFRAKLK